jgi:hypothetical protein
MKNKKGFEMSFAWMFSIIVGAVIIFLAIYIVTQYFLPTKKQEINIQTATKISILLDPLETSLETGKSSIIEFPVETRIYNDRCEYSGSFGYQRIGLSSKSGIGEQWPNPSYPKSIYNKYIFSEEVEQQETFNIFTKPFNMPFKISDLIILSGTEYCFIFNEDSEDIKDELERLNLGNVQISSNKNNCSSQSKKVCFPGTGCDISVYGSVEYGGQNFEQGSVIKQGKTMYYSGNLLYAAIFSSPEVYECNIKRLAKRISHLALIYKDKIKIVESKGCSSTLEPHLISLSNLGLNASSSEIVFSLNNKAEQIDEINQASRCSIY